jgi:ubiquitin-activating enzyme E1
VLDRQVIPDFMPDSNVKIQADDKELDPNANADLGDGTAMLNEISKSLPLAKSLGDFRLKPV